MKKCLHVLFMIAALSLSFTACSTQVDEKDDKTEEVKQPEAQTPESQDPQGQTTDPNQGKDPNKDPDPNQGKDPNQQQDPVYDPYVVVPMNLETITIVSTKNNGSNAFVTEPVAKHVKEAQQSWGDDSNKDKPDPYYEECDISFDGQTFTGKVKVRGNWTTNYAKKSLRIKFDKKHNILGLHNGESYKNWVLLACCKDASFLRDASAFTMFKTMFPGYYASDFRLVNVVINNKNFGIYLLAEQQEVKKGKIEITAAEDNPSSPNIGYLIEFDNYYKNELPEERFEIDYSLLGDIYTYEGHTACSAINKGYTIKSDIGEYDEEVPDSSNTAERVARHDFISDYMNNLWEICYKAAYKNEYYTFNEAYELIPDTPEGNSDDEKIKNCVSKVIDVKSLANTYIFSEITCDPDLYYSSFYMDIDLAEGKDHRLRFEAPWDFDSTMGNKKFCVSGINDDKHYGDINTIYAGNGQPDVNGDFYHNNSNEPYVNPWLVVFIRNAWFQNLVKDIWSKIEQADVKSNISTLINYYSSSTEYVNAFNDTRTKWGKGELGEVNSKAKKAADSQAKAAEYLQDWLNSRIDAVNTIITNLQPQNN